MIVGVKITFGIMFEMFKDTIIMYSEFIKLRLISRLSPRVR